MEQTKLFDTVSGLIGKLDTFKQTGTLSFKDMDEKLALKEVYNKINPGVQVDLGCDKCVLHYLHMLLSWFERENPKFKKATTTIEKVANTVEDVVSIVKVFSKKKKGK